MAQGTLRSTVQRPAHCRYSKQVLRAHTDNSAPNVVLLHRVNRMGDVCGPTTDRYVAESVSRTWCRKWRGTHGVLHYYDK